jgi:phycoerythrin-associated linker protein
MGFVTGTVPVLRGSRGCLSRVVCGKFGRRPCRAPRLAARRRVALASLGDALAQSGVAEDVVQDDPPADGAYDPSGMTVEEFFRMSLGEWRSQRSSHNLVWTQFEAITSDITILEKPIGDAAVLELCRSNSVDPKDVVTSIEMSWEGESDWDDEEEVKGCVLMSVIKDSATTGRLLRSQGYAETIPAVGAWVMTADGAFVLNTFYDAAAAEERIWFATPDLRLRVSNIRTSTGRGVITASFSSEIRSLKRTADD